MYYDDKVLIRLYEQQPLSADALGGTPELAGITAGYRTETGVAIDEGSVLSRLIQLRKSGKLRVREPRVVKEKPPELGEYDRERNCFMVTMPVAVTFDLLLEANEWKGELPCSRAEALAAVVAYVGQKATHEPQYRRDVWERLKYLFRELIAE